MTNEDFISGLQGQLSAPLPGESAQRSMAPPDRELRSILSKTPDRVIDAAVLILLYQMNGSLNTAFIKRTEYPGPHSGQISFPGGRSDMGDKDLWETALREAKEEIGIEPENVEKLGSLTPLFIPVSQFMVYPFIGFTPVEVSFRKQPEEVQFILTVELKELLDPGKRSQMKVPVAGRQISVPCINVGGHQIWGATAMILGEFFPGSKCRQA